MNDNHIIIILILDLKRSDEFLNYNFIQQCMLVNLNKTKYVSVCNYILESKNISNFNFNDCFYKKIASSWYFWRGKVKIYSFSTF